MSKYLNLFIPILLFWPPTLYSEEGPKWTYEGDRGPERWGVLAVDFDMCKRGLNQSPVDLVADLDADLPELSFEYTNPGRLEEVNTGHAIQEIVQPGNYIRFKGVRYELKQFHFHSPSEHLVDGETYPMEVHLVHQNPKGSYLVIGLFMEEGAHNEIVNGLPSFRARRGEAPYGDPVDYNLLIPNRRDYFYYNGSLTTPPCTEGVTWIVIQEPIIASSEQMAHYHDLLGFDNNRPIQPKNSRLLLD